MRPKKEPFLQRFTVYDYLQLLIIIVCVLLAVLPHKADAQVTVKEYNTLEEALKEPEKVFRLNLQNQQLDHLEEIAKFKNLQYLNLRNTHLSSVPPEVTTLQNLKVLDIGDNEIALLPKNFDALKNLTELYLDKEKNLQLEEDLEILGRMKNLKILHLENNGIRVLPKNINKLQKIEALYLGDNKLEAIPVELKELKKLKFLDVHHNPIIPTDVIKRNYGGLKINF
ncbi:leucine-rich repeat domain-containing protein [Pedobacter glucosidilyticus]|uniref:leucine-rich repeat domain-containing protein n=1 Tax=Pedobacter glucosidilyticus TaxID=1122941 RepID=UPI0026F0744D|nr:leucine-rich repeat domain-containing protein [Pedobacter glucosidilyticus]